MIRYVEYEYDTRIQPLFHTRDNMQSQVFLQACIHLLAPPFQFSKLPIRNTLTNRYRVQSRAHTISPVRIFHSCPIRSSTSTFASFASFAPSPARSLLSLSSSSIQKMFAAFEGGVGPDERPPPRIRVQKPRHPIASNIIPPSRPSLPPRWF